ncbi:DUF6894 family protein [Sphingomonas sp.]|jgi:hypothetical protein|uniref:DUF6894 family protein n=1 Tax=Sphingomonas sp. TaxID=28214 RepID=UPI002EDB71F5
MARYFLNIYDDLIVLDEEGVELPNLEAARLQALHGARDLMVEQVRHGYIVLSHWIDVVDESGTVVLRLPFRDAIDIKD